MALSDYSEQLNAYKSACEEHPKLKSFDSSLQEQTSKVIVKLADASKKDPLSPYAVHKEISEHLLEVTEGLAKLITEAGCDVWESEALKDLVMAYFESTNKTLKIFRTIEDCVPDAERGQGYIEDAVEQFKKEDHVGGKKNKYEKTLKYLNKFKAMGDPFHCKLLTSQLDLISKQQESLMKAASEAKQKLQEEIDLINKDGEEIKRAEHATVTANGVLGAVVAVSTVASILGGVASAIGALGGPLLTAGWGDVLTTLREKMDALEKQLQGMKILMGIETSVEQGITTNKIASENVCNEVTELESMIQNMLKDVDDAVEDKDEVSKNTLKRISENAKKVTEEIKEVGESVNKHRKLILEARTQVVEKILGKR